jgi:hypothetical protein
MLKKFTRNDRALSPIFATLIILTVVTVLFIPVFIWAAGMTSSTQESWQFSGAVTTERIVIEEISLIGTTNPNTCTIYVRNIGETAITINNIIISADDAVIQIYQKGSFQTYKPGTSHTQSITSVSKGNLIEIYIPDLLFPLTNPKTYSIQVATAKGVSDTYITVASWLT